VVLYYIIIIKKLTQVHSHYPCEKSVMEEIFVKLC